MQREALIGDRFELEERLGSGGMGIVYRARDREGGLAAVKVLHASTSNARFARECANLSSLAHPNIVRYLAHAEQPTPFLAMEWIPGPTLASRLADPGLDLAECVRVMRQLASALATAHDRGIVHRDLKPTNVIFRGGDLAQTILIDFGISHATFGAPLTRTGTTVGTPGYMAPEQTTGSRELDGRADVFGLGCVFYECITGLPAFAGANLLAVQAKICLGEPEGARQFCPALPPAIDDLLAAMLAKAPANRPDASTVVARLSAITDIPSTPRRTSSTMLATPTLQPHLAPVRCTVLCTSAKAPTPSEVVDRLRDDLAVRVDSLVVLHDGTIVAEVASERALDRAAQLALELRAALADHIIVVTCTTSTSREEVDRGADMAATMALGAVFTPSFASMIYLDPSTARQLRDLGYRVELTDQGGRLV